MIQQVTSIDAASNQAYDYHTQKSQIHTGHITRLSEHNVYLKPFSGFIKKCYKITFALWFF